MMFEKLEKARLDVAPSKRASGNVLFALHCAAMLILTSCGAFCKWGLFAFFGGWRLLNSGFVMISRSFTSWVWYGDITMRSLFLDMIMRANYKNGVLCGTTIERGQFVSSIRKLAKENNLSVGQVRTGVGRLKKCGELTCQQTRKGTLFTLVNYDNWTGATQQHMPPELGEYDDFQEEATQQRTPNDTPNDTPANIPLTGEIDGFQRMSDTQFDTPNDTQYKESLRKINNPPYNPPRGGRGASGFLNREEAVARIESLTPDEGLQQAAIDWLDMRLANKKRVTERALILTFSKLHKLASSAPEAVQIFEQSTINGWAGIFPVKGGAGR